MRRRPTAFYKEFHEHRQSFGQSEYDVEDMIGGAVPILRKYLTDDDELERDILRAINDGIEENENNPLQGELFSHDAHTALGERRRIKRGRMTSDQALRRKLIVDDNQIRQTAAWATETKWLNTTIAALRSFPADTVREEVLNEDGTPA